MGGLFDPTSKFSNFMGKVGDLIILSFFWCLLTATIVLAAPACSAVYYACVKSIRSEYGIARREFFHSFGVNWRQGICVGLLMGLYGLAVYGCIRFSGMLDLEDPLQLLYWALARMLVLPPLFVAPWIFALLARFTMGMVDLLKTSFYFGVRHFMTTLLLLAGMVACLFCILNAPILALLFPAAFALAASYFTERIFGQYVPADGEEGTGTWKLDK